MFNYVQLLSGKRATMFHVKVNNKTILNTAVAFCLLSNIGLASGTPAIALEDNVNHWAVHNASSSLQVDHRPMTFDSGSDIDKRWQAGYDRLFLDKRANIILC